MGHGHADPAEVLDLRFHLAVLHGVDLGHNVSRESLEIEHTKLHTMDMVIRRERASIHALDAFWTAVAQQFPDASAGDMDPVSLMRFDDAARDIVKEWVHNNVGPVTEEKEV